MFHLFFCFEITFENLKRRYDLLIHEKSRRMFIQSAINKKYTQTFLNLSMSNNLTDFKIFASFVAP